MNLKKNIAFGCMFLLSSLLTTPSVFAAQKAVMHANATASQPVHFDVFLPLQHRDQLQQLLADQQDSKSAMYHHWLTPEEFNARFAAGASQISAIQKQLGGYGLTAIGGLGPSAACDGECFVGGACLWDQPEQWHVC